MILSVLRQMDSTLNQDLLKRSGTTGDSKYMFYFELKNRRYICQQCGKAKKLQILDFLPQRHGQKRPNSVHIRHLIVKVPSSCPKIANDTHLFSQPTSSMPWGHRLTIWDPGGPISSPKPPYIPPKGPNFPYPLST